MLLALAIIILVFAAVVGVVIEITLLVVIPRRILRSPFLLWALAIVPPCLFYYLAFRFFLSLVIYPSTWDNASTLSFLGTMLQASAGLMGLILAVLALAYQKARDDFVQDARVIELLDLLNSIRNRLEDSRGLPSVVSTRMLRFDLHHSVFTLGVYTIILTLAVSAGCSIAVVAFSIMVHHGGAQLRVLQAMEMLLSNPEMVNSAAGLFLLSVSYFLFGALPLAFHYISYPQYMEMYHPASDISDKFADLFTVLEKGEIIKKVEDALQKLPNVLTMERVFQLFDFFCFEVLLRYSPSELWVHQHRGLKHDSAALRARYTRFKRFVQKENYDHSVLKGVEAYIYYDLFEEFVDGVSILKPNWFGLTDQDVISIQSQWMKIPPIIMMGEGVAAIRMRITQAVVRHLFLFDMYLEDGVRMLARLAQIDKRTVQNAFEIEFKRYKLSQVGTVRLDDLMRAGPLPDEFVSCLIRGVRSLTDPKQGGPSVQLLHESISFFLNVYAQRDGPIRDEAKEAWVETLWHSIDPQDPQVGRKETRWLAVLEGLARSRDISKRIAAIEPALMLYRAGRGKVAEILRLLLTDPETAVRRSVRRALETDELRSLDKLRHKTNSNAREQSLSAIT